MHAVLAWLAAGQPPHFLYLVAALFVVEDALARSKRIPANSTIQLVADGVRGILVAVFPALAKVLAALGSKAGPLALLLATSVALSGCASLSPSMKAKLAADETHCAETALEGAAASAADEAVSDLDGYMARGSVPTSADLKAEAANLGIKYGVAAAWCAITHLLADLTSSSVASAGDGVMLARRDHGHRHRARPEHAAALRTIRDFLGGK